MKKILNKKNIIRYSMLTIVLVLIITSITLFVVNLSTFQKNKKLQNEERLKLQARNNIQTIIDQTNNTIMQTENRDANIKDLKEELLRQGYILDETCNEIQYKDNIIVTINDKLNIEKVEDSNIKVYCTTEAVKGNVAEVLVTVEGKSIEKIICEDTTIINKNQKNKIAFDREFEEDKEYDIGIKLQADETIRIYHLIYSTNPKIEILQDEFSENIEEKNIEITYPNNENLINYYSLDDGNTWIQCNGEENKQVLKVHLNDKQTISAKSIYKTEKTIHNEKIFYKFALAESLLQATDELIKEGKYYRINVNNEEYYAHTYVYNEDTVISENMVYGDIQDIGLASTNAKHTVIVKVNGNLTIEGNKTLTAYGTKYGGPKGLLLYITGELINNGTITMTARGAKSEGQNVYLWKNKNEESSEYEFVPKEGAVGGAASVHGLAGNKGTNRTGRKTARRRLWLLMGWSSISKIWKRWEWHFLLWWRRWRCKFW